jgi:hypothetical protein
MKKSIILAGLSLATGVVSSHGQGYVVFSSYVAKNDIGATTTFFGWPSGNPFLLTSGWKADLFYAIGSVSDPVNFSSLSSTSAMPTGLTDSSVSQTYSTGVPPGYFHGGIVIIPSYVSGPIAFEVVAYNGSSPATSTWRGRSGSFTMSSIATSPNPVPALGDNGQPMPDFIVGVPEPTMLSLAGFDGLVSLVAFRRKQSNIEL